jgi:Family of unknown function (DUF6502)
MDTSNRLHTALTSAMLQLLRPLCRLLLRHNIPFGVLEELAKHAYVQVAMADFGIPGKKPSMSRASILTGLTRKDVQRLVAGPEPVRALPAADGYNRAARVLTGWARDPHYQDEFGQPLPLSVQDGEHNFSELVRRHSGDMPVRAVLDELVRVGAVARRDDQLLELVARAYVPKASEVDKLAILGTDVADLITTIDHNLQHGDTSPRYQRKVMYLSIPMAVVPEFKRESAARAQALLEHLDRWLAERDTEPLNDQPDAERVRLGLGIYHIEAPAAATFPKEN